MRNRDSKFCEPVSSPQYPSGQALNSSADFQVSFYLETRLSVLQFSSITYGRTSSIRQLANKYNPATLHSSKRSNKPGTNQSQSRRIQVQTVVITFIRWFQVLRGEYFKYVPISSRDIRDLRVQVH